MPYLRAWRTLRWLPLVACAVAFGTLYTCWRLATELGHVPEGATMAPISLLVTRPPVRAIYAVGMTAVSVMFLGMAYPFKLYLERTAERALADKVTGLWTSGAVAFVGLAVQGIVPLQPDIWDSFVDPDAEPPQLTAASMIHQSAAGVFFVGSMWHAVQAMQLLHGSAALPFRSRASWYIKAVCATMALLPLLQSLVHHPATGISSNSEWQQLNATGRSQYIVVLGFTLFYTSYWFEFNTLAAMSYAAERSRASTAAVGSRRKAVPADVSDSEPDDRAPDLVDGRAHAD